MITHPILQVLCMSSQQPCFQFVTQSPRKCNLQSGEYSSSKGTAARTAKHRLPTMAIRKGRSRGKGGDRFRDTDQLLRGSTQSTDGSSTSEIRSRRCERLTAVRICEYAQGAGRTTLCVGPSAGKHNAVNRVISTKTPDGGNSKGAI